MQKFFKRVTISFVTAAKLAPDDDLNDLFDANGVKPRFNRTWWFWLPRIKWLTAPKYMPTYGIMWLCWIFDITVWPYSVR
jgi:hypothetical protein